MVLNENNFVVYAMKHYDNPQCFSTDDFEEDMKRFLYLKKLLARYKQNKDLKHRLILNHIIIIHNIFGEAANNLLFFKINKEYWDILGTFLVYLEKLPEYLAEHKLYASDLHLDYNVIREMRNI